MRKHYDKELDQLDRLKHENDKLKREIEKLKKSLDKYGVLFEETEDESDT